MQRVCGVYPPCNILVTSWACLGQRMLNELIFGSVPVHMKHSELEIFSAANPFPTSDAVATGVVCV